MKFKTNFQFKCLFILSIEKIKKKMLTSEFFFSKYLNKKKKKRNINLSK